MATAPVPYMRSSQPDRPLAVADDAYRINKSMRFVSNDSYPCSENMRATLDRESGHIIRQGTMRIPRTELQVPAETRRHAVGGSTWEIDWALLDDEWTVIKAGDPPQEGTP